MLTYVLRRIGWAAVLLLAVTLVTFVLFYVVPHRDPSGRGAFSEFVQRDDSGVNRFEVQGSVFSEYVEYVGDLAQGDLGRSWRTREPVTDVIERAAPATASLVLGGVVIWLLVAGSIGIASAMRPRSTVDKAGMIFVLAGMSAHPLWLGYVFAWFFGYKLGWFPLAGYCDIFKPTSGETCGGPVQWAYHLVLPWVVFAAAFAALYARMIRASLIECGDEDYVRTARAKGLSESSILRRHTLRNALLPVVSMVGMDIGIAFGSTIFVERVFRIPGLGSLTIASLQRRDLPVILGVVVLVAIVIVICNLVVDLLLGVLDPRISGGVQRRRKADRPERGEAPRAAPAPQPR